MLKRVVVKGFYKDLLFGIVIVLLLLGVCVSVDYADDSPINNIKNSPLEIHNKSVKVVNKSSFVDVNDKGSYFVANGSDKIHTIRTKKVKKNKKKPKKTLPTVTITAKPSVRSGYAYKWYTTTWIDYCPHCNRYGVLYNAHKYQARFEQELTCRRCGADYCGVVGKEKYSWSNYYLRKC